MIAEVGNKPDHPKRRAADDERRRRNAGPDRTERRLYYLDDEHWRFNDSNTADGTYLDQTTTPEEIWLLTPASMTITSPHVPPPPGRDYGSALHDFAAEALDFAWARLQRRGPVVSSPLSAATTEGAGGWSARVGSAGYLFEYRGVGLPPGVLEIDSCKVLQSASRPSAVGSVTEYSDWKPEEAFGRPAAHRIRERDERGHLVRELVLVSVRPLDASEFARLSRYPDLGESDAVRGAVTYNTISDFRPGAESLTVHSPDGEKRYPLPASELGRLPSSTLRHVGWWSVAAVTALLVGIHIWRNRSKG
ncbi:MAG: hypothetical protein IT437_09735 [Phycisphaerales bacterium]|nr:hypothetical protein [Phycisphaerales bacterium]